VGPTELFYIIAGLAIVIFVFSACWASRLRKVGPNQAMVISGRAFHYIDSISGERVTRGFRIIKGGGTFVWPIIERVDLLSLEVLNLEVEILRVHTAQQVPISLRGLAQVRIAGDEQSIARAAERFLSKSTPEMERAVLQHLETHLRERLPSYELEQIRAHPTAFAREVQDSWAEALSKLGLEVVSFTVKEIRQD
jgi:flotillin